MKASPYAVVLPLATWVISLAGLCTLQNITQDLPITDTAKARSFRSEWWSVSLEFAVLALILVAAVLGKINNFRGALLALLAVTTVRYMDLASDYLGAVDTANDNDATGKGVRAVTTLFAGAIATSVGNFLMILILGMNLDGGDDAPAAKGSAV